MILKTCIRNLSAHQNHPSYERENSRINVWFTFIVYLFFVNSIEPW